MKPILEPADDPLRGLLRSARPGPPLPPGFQEGVWHRLERARATAPTAGSPLAWLDRWVERLLRPRFVVVSLALFLVAGGLSGLLTSAGMVRHAAQSRYVAAVAPNPVR